MKRYFRKLLVVLFPMTVLMLNSCGWIEFETSDNGDLDGYWHLVSVDTLSTGGTLDVSEKRTFWSIQATLLQVYSLDINGGQRYISRFTYEDNRIKLEGMRTHNRADGDPVVEDVSVLTQYGIHELSESFVVESLSSSRMTLRSEGYRLWYKKM